MKRRHFLIGLGAATAAVALPNVSIRTKKDDRSSWYLDLSDNSSKAFASVEAARLLTPDQIKWAVARAMMKTVSRCEGAWKPGKSIDETYKVIYGYEYFESYDSHPGNVVSKGAWASDAAGAYQFMSYTWNPLVDRYKYWYKGPEFSPANQDLGFLRLFTEIGAFFELERGIKVLNQKVSVTEDALIKSISKASSTWCSLPGSHRGMCGGGVIDGVYYPPQPHKDWDTVIGYFNREMKLQQGIEVE